MGQVIVMTRPPAFHIWKFLMKNMTPPNSIAFCNLCMNFIIANTIVMQSVMQIFCLIDGVMSEYYFETIKSLMLSD